MHHLASILLFYGAFYAFIRAIVEEVWKREATKVL